MNRKINTVKIFCNDNAKVAKIKNIIVDKLVENNYSIVDENPDLCLTIGGDNNIYKDIEKLKLLLIKNVLNA